MRFGACLNLQRYFFHDLLFSCATVGLPRYRNELCHEGQRRCCKALHFDAFINLQWGFSSIAAVKSRQIRQKSRKTYTTPLKPTTKDRNTQCSEKYKSTASVCDGIAAPAWMSPMSEPLNALMRLAGAEFPLTLSTKYCVG